MKVEHQFPKPEGPNSTIKPDRAAAGLYEMDDLARYPALFDALATADAATLKDILDIAVTARNPFMLALVSAVARRGYRTSLEEFRRGDRLPTVPRPEGEALGRLSLSAADAMASLVIEEEFSGGTDMTPWAPDRTTSEYVPSTIKD